MIGSLYLNRAGELALTPKFVFRCVGLAAVRRLSIELDPSVQKGA